MATTGMLAAASRNVNTKHSLTLVSSLDSRIDHSEFSFEHMVEFSKLAVAFAVELGGSKKKY
jgi:hypothetical protein